MRKSWVLALGLVVPGCADAQDPQNAGGIAPEPLSAAPFRLEQVAQFDTPWAVAPLPDGRLLVSTKPGELWLVSSGAAEQVAGVPDVQYSGQNGFLDIAPAPDFAQSAQVYFTYVSPGNALVLARARLGEGRLEGTETIWSQTPGGRGQPGGIIAFGADGMLYLTVGDRMQPDTAQDPDNPRGKVLRMTLDGAPAPGNPWADQGGVRALSYTTGHRNPYGLVFGAGGALWLHEMGPRGGDELNRLEPGKNYGWPEVSNGRQYSGLPIPDHDTRLEFAAPTLWWDPVIAPSGMIAVSGEAWPDWRGSLLIGGLRGEGLVRVSPDGTQQLDRWDLGMRVRDVAEDEAGALWIIEDSEEGGLYRLMPK